MKIFKHIGCYLAMAFAMFALPSAYAAEMVVSYAVSAQACDYTRSAEKFMIELAYQAGAGESFASTINSDLSRDGHGFRQFSAMELAVGMPDYPITA